MSKVEDIKWSRQSYTLKDVLKKYTFPQILKVTAGSYSPEENENLTAGQVLRIHQLCRQTRVLASDRKGNHISIPIRYGSARFEIINNGKKSKPMYLREIIDKSLLPREVRFAVDDDPRFRLQYANTITVEEKFNSLLLRTMYEESFIQGNAINQNLLDTMVINLPVHAKVEVVVAECFRDSPIATWDRYTNLLERLVTKHVTFKLNSGNNQISFFTDKRLEKNNTQKDIERSSPAAILYVETKLKRRAPVAGSPTSKTVGPARTRSKSVDQLAEEKPRSLGVRGSKKYVNAMQRDERLKKAVSTGDILKDTELSKQKNRKNKKDSGSEKGSFSGWLLGTLTGRKKKKRQSVIEKQPENDQASKNVVSGRKPIQEKSKESTPQNGRGRKAAKSTEKPTAEKRSKSQPAREKQQAPKSSDSNSDLSVSKSKEPPQKVNKTGSPLAFDGTKNHNTPAKKTVKALTPPEKTAPPKSAESAQSQAKTTTNNQSKAKPKQEKSVKDANNQTTSQNTEVQKTPTSNKDNATSTTPKSILKKGGTPSISSYSSTSSGDVRTDVRNESRPETRIEPSPEVKNSSQIETVKDPRHVGPAEGTEFYATLRKNMPVDIPVPDYKRQEMEQQRAMFAYGTTPRATTRYNQQPFNNNWQNQSDIINISSNQHIVGAIVHQFPEDQTDYMNAEVEMYPHHIYANNSYNLDPPSPPPPPAFRDLGFQPPAAPPPPPIGFNSAQQSPQRSFTRSEPEPLPQNQFSSQLVKLKPVAPSPKPKPQSQTGDLMAELKIATDRRNSRPDLLLKMNGLNSSPFNNGYSPRRQSDGLSFSNPPKFTHGGTLTKRQFSTPTINYTPRIGPQTQPKPKFRNLNNSSSELRNMREVPHDLKGVNVAQISDCMRLLNLEKYIETFKTHKIDGDMLCDLNKEMLKSDLGMSEIDAAKVMKFAKGWRPQ
ncbi:serine/arginine repetitive matrix protein 1-like [Anneissia japonica]|uniref:serine/arginine repetitive matrix protein 1-like n=1 Tax=Anneissia japonica TaxID=1529436 RepID=UPI00142593A5|nr:serine/arginine repetitive matrix protein 1-like [Anneissia japonica]XP_033104259.1 serine/arginine repetitive matrix protein 1-like [Anneissia japonica]